MNKPTYLELEQINIRIAMLMGIQPLRRWRVFYDIDRQNGSLCLESKWDAYQNIERDKDFWIENCIEPPARAYSEPEEYDEWGRAPRYVSSLDDVHEAETKLLHLDNKELLYNDASVYRKLNEYEFLLKGNIFAEAWQRAYCLDLLFNQKPTHEH